MDYREWLAERLRQKQLKNNRYSMRAFAKAIGLSPASLSGVLNGTRRVTPGMARRVADALNLVGFERQVFLDPQSHRPDDGTAASDGVALDQWCHQAVLRLVSTGPCRADPEWIADRLALPVASARSAIEHLLSAGYVTQDASHLIHLAATMSNKPTVLDATCVDFHRQALAVIAKAVESNRSDDCDVSTIVMAIDANRLNEAKMMIQGFCHMMSRLLQTGETREVYCLSVGLVAVGPQTPDDDDQETPSQE